MPPGGTNARAVVGAFARASARLSRWRARRKIGLIFATMEADYQHLLRFGMESDRQFTTLAEGLARMDTQLSQISRKTLTLGHSLSDQDEDHALSSAFTHYRRSVDLVHSSMGLALSEEEQMELIEDRLLGDKDRFVQNNMLFKSLVTLIRIEAARIDTDNQNVFAHVAAEVSDMVMRMSEIATRAFGNIEQVILEGAQGRCELEALQADLTAQARRSADLLRGELERIRAALVPCAGRSKEILTILSETKVATSSVATSLQYQDIVRQKLEHVAMGFRDIVDHITDPDNPGHLKRSSKLDLGYLHHAIRVQQVHIAESKSSIAAAGLEVTRGMNELLKKGEALVAEFAKMEEAAEAAFKGSRMAELFRVETRGLIEISAQGERTNKRVQWLVGRVEDFARVFTEDISRQEFDVKLVALNAEVAAARLPSAGALGRLAEETSRLSDDTTRITSSMSTELNEALRKLQGVRTESNKTRKTLDQEKSELLFQMPGVSDKLADLNDCVQRHSSEVGRDFGAVHQEIREILPTFNFPSLIEECFGPAEALCRHLLDLTSAFASPEDLDVGAVARLDAHKGRYTMQSEHAAHRAALDGSAEAPGGAEPLPPASPGEAVLAPPETTPAPTGQDDANIELF